MTEQYFFNFRKGILGIDQEFPTPLGVKKMIYADWVASGRLYRPIEECMLNDLGPYCANTHSETSLTGTLMTHTYHESKLFIKKCVHANEDDILIYSGSGMTDSVNKLQRMLGLRIPEASPKFFDRYELKSGDDRPIVFVTHLEHHSNHTSWIETIAEVEIIKPDTEGEVDLHYFAKLLEKYKSRSVKIASITACSNVTGIFTPYHKMAEMIHDVGGLCFVDFACSAPYVDIVMRPTNEKQYLDAIYFSPHKFLGGPGTPGVMIINKNILHNNIPDNPGGGTVKFTSPWLRHEFIDNQEEREDGGTPPFLQGIKASLCFKLKNEMGVNNILLREKPLIAKVIRSLSTIPNVRVLAEHLTERIGAISFNIQDVHYNLVVRLMNDYFGIQVRGGCACAGTYGHYLLDIGHDLSVFILNKIREGRQFNRPGWIRISLHPTHTDHEIDTILEAIEYIAKNHQNLSLLYKYDDSSNSFFRIGYDYNFENSFVEKFYNKNLVSPLSSLNVH